MDGSATSTSGRGAAASDRPPGPAPGRGMVWVPGGTFVMGSDRHYAEEAPAREVTVDGFWMDRCAVTNAEFRRFVEDTGHVTVAERPPDLADYPGADPARLMAASAVFRTPRRPVSLCDPYEWWVYVPGASWRHPRGPQSSVKRLDDHPVVHVAWDDVVAYTAWAGKEPPTEAEWERAARGGLDGAEYAWGDELTPGGRHMANVWQGEFPRRNECLDGYEYTAPVRSFPSNGYGLFEMTGNVWEWTCDWYRDRPAAPDPVAASGPADHGAGEQACCTAGDRGSAVREASIDARDPARVPRKVMKGGSHLCAPNYCRRYRPAARMAQPIDTSTSHLGFRGIVRANA